MNSDEEKHKKIYLVIGENESKHNEFIKFLSLNDNLND